MSNQLILNQESSAGLIRTEIERLREQIKNTRDLYHEVCCLLIFKFGTTPTANQLYQLVRKGSMSVPADSLSKFWDTVREKCRVNIENPELPEDLKTLAGELVGTVWNKALREANKSLEEHRHEVDVKVDQIQATLLKAKEQSIEAKKRLALVNQEFADAQQQIKVLERLLAEANTKVSLTEERVEQVRADFKQMLASHDEARREFGVELDKLRNCIALAEERCQATEKRALIDIDRERTTAAKLRKEQERLRESLEKSSAQLRQENAELRIQLARFQRKSVSLDRARDESPERPE